MKIAKKYKLDYTRYADDLTFSTNNKAFLDEQELFLKKLSREVESAGFLINNKKSRLQYKDSKQKVTGLVVNKKVSVDREYCRITKAMAHTLYTKGSFIIDRQEGTLKQLEGRFAFINQLDKYDNSLEYKAKHRNFHSLNGREKQYQKFLFYKYFCANEKPLLITEGKTDVTYLKAALKNLHLEYPYLISKEDDSEFKFNISFLRRTKRLRYFFNLSLDGADTMEQFYKNFFTLSGNGNHSDYPSIFNRICPYHTNKPVIFIFDNELATKNKPLKKFADSLNLDKDKRAKLQRELKLKLADNLWLVTNNLIAGKEVCEIEDLFTRETLEHEIDGRSFSHIEKTGSSGYSKEDFAQYIAKNYKNIDFSGFKCIFNEINEVIQPSLEI